MVSLKTSNKTELAFDLYNPGYTIYHRAALGGLAATIRSWTKRPEGLKEANVSENSVHLIWDDGLDLSECLQKLLHASFRLSEDNLIDLPGLGIREGSKDLQVAVHNAITQTFLQHHTSRKGPKEIKKFALKNVDDNETFLFSYKPVNSYTHQSAQGLLSKSTGFSSKATISQSLVPGAFSGARGLDAKSEEVFLLLYLMVGSVIFSLRPRSFKEKAQYCVIVPNVINLTAFAKSLHRITARESNSPFKCNRLEDRVLGGAEDAALRFLLDLRLAETLGNEQRSVSSCVAITMGKVAWDSKQINRSMVVKVHGDYPEIDIYRAAYEYLGRAKIIRTKKDEGFVLPSSDVPALIAANLANEHHWCSGFVALMSEQKEAKRLFFDREGFRKMVSAIKDEDDRVVIEMFHEAWRRTLGKIGERAGREKLNVERLMEVEREKTRTAILRAKSSEMLSNWFLRFCSDATKGGSLQIIKQNPERIRRFMFENRNFERFQNLCLFALVSYEGKSRDSRENN